MGGRPIKLVLMSKVGKSNERPKGVEEKATFEEAIQRLAAIVEGMEAEDLPLETLLARYEEGTRLAKVCQARLAEAELTIQRLEKDLAGEFKLKTEGLEAEGVE